MNWYEQAECIDMNVNVFFPKFNEYARARSVCKDCKVQRECLESTINRENDNYGMFGGLTPSERHLLREERQKR
jgi:hypothetical protein